MGNCLSANTNKRDGLFKLRGTLDCKSTQTDKYNEDESDEKAEKERHFHVLYSKAVILGDNGQIIVGKNKRKKSSGSLHPEIKSQHLNSTYESSSSSNQSENEYNEKLNQKVARPMDLESSTSGSEKTTSDDSEEERSRFDAMLKSKQSKTEGEVMKVLSKYREDLKKQSEAKFKSLEKQLIGKFTIAGISDRSQMRKLQRLDTLTSNEKSSNMYIVT